MTKNLLTILVVAAGLSVLTLNSVSIIGVTESYSQTAETQAKSQSSNTIHITKDASNSYVLSSGSSQIGTFDTTYTIAGSVTSLKESNDLVTSTIIKDFDKSPVIGYVIAHKSKSNSNLPTLANPFVDKTTINEKIKSEIQSSIGSSQKLKTTQAEIKCNFGMEIKDWKCSTHGLLG
jgi:hypothetical protein